MNITHTELVAAMVKPGSVIAANITANEADMLHMAVGVSGEAGELLDAVKKATIYKKPIDRENVIEELGEACARISASLDRKRSTPISQNCQYDMPVLLTLTRQHNSAPIRFDTATRFNLTVIQRLEGELDI